MTDHADHLRLRFVGRRFHGTRLPVGVLPDIEAFRDLLVAFAKVEWLSANTGRQRVPRGFEDHIQIDLIGLEAGSAVPVLSPRVNDVEGMYAIIEETSFQILAKAYGKVSQLFDRAITEPDYKPVLRRDQMNALNRFGAGLRHDETIEFLGSTSASGGSVSISSQSRKDLITRIRETYERKHEGAGILEAVSLEGWIQVKTAEYGVIRLDVAERSREEFDGYLGSDMGLDVTLELDADDRVRSVIGIHSVELMDAYSHEESGVDTVIVDRIAFLADLRQGWLEGEGEPISGEAISALRDLVAYHREWFSGSGIFPTPEGGIQIETIRSAQEYVFVIEPDGELSGYICQVDDGDEILELGRPDILAVLEEGSR